MELSKHLNSCLQGVSERPSEDIVEDVHKKSRVSTHLGGPEQDRSGPAPQRSSASVRRALFARRRLDASSSPGGPPSPGVASTAPLKPLTPPRSPSPGPLRSSTPPSSPSGSTLRTGSPGPSPVVRTCVLEPCGPLGSLADSSARFHGDRAAAARPVSPFIHPAVSTSLCFYFRPLALALRFCRGYN